MPVNYTFCMINDLFSSETFHVTVPVFKNYLLTNIIYSQYILLSTLPPLYSAWRRNYSRSELLSFRNSTSSVSEPVGLPAFLQCTPPPTPPFVVATPVKRRPRASSFICGVCYIMYTHVYLYVYNTLARICVGNCQVTSV